MSAGRPSAAGWTEGVAIALDALWANKLRSFLTVLGNVIAVTSIILVVTIIRGLDDEVTSIFTAEGADVFTVRRTGIVFSEEEARAQRSRPRLTREDARILRKEARTFAAVVEEVGASGGIEYRDQRLDRVSIRGRSYDFALIDTTGLQAGRYFSPLETDRNRTVALLGADVAEHLFPGVDPRAIVGRRIRVADAHFTVVGVLRARGAIFGSSQDEFVVIPIGAFQRRFGARRSLSFTVKPETPERLDAALDEARLLMRIRHKLRPGEDDDFAIVTADTFLDLYRQATTGVYAVLVGVVAMSLVVGGIVIMNIMLMVVTERTREIGTRKAVGATTNQILWQFLVEAVTVSLCGGAIGIALGYGAASVVAAFTPLPFVLELWSVVVAIIVVTVVGVVFGIYPASRAARLDPIDALRYE